jgi:signal transduction histidine kinase
MLSGVTRAPGNRDEERPWSLSHVGVVADRSVGVMLIDGRGVVHDATAGACELLGVGSLDELRSEGHAVCEQLRVALGEAAPLSQSFDLSFDVCGSARVLRCHVHTLTEDDRLAYLVLLQGAAHVAAIERAVLLADRAQMLGSVHMMAAHDLRDSLNSMTVNLELLSRTLEDEDAGQTPAIRQRCMAALRREVNRLALETGSALEESRLGAEPAGRVRLAKIIESIGSMLRNRALRQRVAVHFVPPANEIEVVGKASELRHAMFNLAVNGLDAMPGGGDLTFDLAAAGPTAVISVSDTGGGLPPDLRSRVWDLFVSTKPEGLGLGLHVVKRVAASHGGTVTVDDREEGVTVTMRLPLIRSKDS